jgi:hypothetical protein
LHGEEVEVTIRVINVNDYDVDDLVLYDYIPENYEYVEVDSDSKINNGRITFSIDNISSYGTKVFKYKIRNNDELKGIAYLEPAKLVYEDENYFSDGVLLVNTMIDEEDRIFVQKEIEYIDDDFAKVTIKVKNLASVTVEDILITEDMDDNAVIKDISKLFHDGNRGVWMIKSLKPGEEWEVSYLTDRNSNIYTLTNAYGLGVDGEVLGTLISSEEVVTVFKDEPGLIEKVGLGIAVGLLVVYLLF